MPFAANTFFEPASTAVGYIVEDKFIKGGYKVIDTSSDKDTLHPATVKDGMLLYARSDNKFWLRVNGNFQEVSLTKGAKTVIVASETNRFLLNSSLVSIGDFVLQTDDNSLWVVINLSSLSNQYGYASSVTGLSEFGKQLIAQNDAASVKTLLSIVQGSGNNVYIVYSRAERIAISGLRVGDIVKQLDDKSVWIVKDSTKTYSDAGWSDIFEFMTPYGKHLSMLGSLADLQNELSLSGGHPVLSVSSTGDIYSYALKAPGDLFWVTSASQLYMWTGTTALSVMSSISPLGFSLITKYSASEMATVLGLSSAAFAAFGILSGTVSEGNHQHTAQDFSAIAWSLSTKATDIADTDRIILNQTSTSCQVLTWASIKEKLLTDVFGYFDSVGLTNEVVNVFLAGSPVASQKFNSVIFTRKVKFPINLSTSHGSVTASPSSSYVITLKFTLDSAGGTTKTGTITVATTGTITFALSAAITVMSGDKLEITGPSSVSTLTDLTLAIVGNVVLDATVI